MVPKQRCRSVSLDLLGIMSTLVHDRLDNTKSTPVNATVGEYGKVLLVRALEVSGCTVDERNVRGQISCCSSSARRVGVGCKMPLSRSLASEWAQRVLPQTLFGLQERRCDMGRVEIRRRTSGVDRNGRLVEGR